MRYIYALGYLAIPAAYLVHLWLGKGQAWEPVTTFVLAGLGIIPLAHLMGVSTEQLAERTGPTWGGLLNATFGNAAELIIGIIGLTKGLNDIVKATVTGSILGNLLLVAGGAMLIGGWNREKQEFNRSSAQVNAGMLVVAVASMLFPAIFHFSFQPRDPDIVAHEHGVSIGTSIILLLVYGLGLLFTLRTHAHIFSPEPARHDEDPRRGIASTSKRWSSRRSILILLIASVAIAFVAELLVGSAERMAHDLGWNRIFIGVILLATIGNAAEHSTAVMLAIHDDMDTAMTITYQSSLQIALFVTPVLVLLSAAMVAAGVPRQTYMDLLFSPMEVVAVVLTVLIIVVVHLDGRTNWFEGVMLLAMYAILAIAFFYIPAGVGHPG